MIDIDGDDKIEVLLLICLHQQGNDMHDNGIGTGSPLQLLGSCPDRRVNDSLEITTCNRISKDDFGKPRPIKPPVSQHLRTESLDDRSKPRSPGLDNFTGEYVGVDDDSTSCRQLGGNQAFARRDAAGQANTLRKVRNQLAPVSF